MKKTILYGFLTVVITSIILTGCKSSDQKKAEKELKKVWGNDLSDEDIEQLAGVYADFEESKKELQKEAQTKEKKLSRMEKYPLSSEWNGITVADHAIQIDDIVLKRGQKLSEVMDIIDESECDYSSDYNPEAVSIFNEEIRVQVSKEDIPWFAVVARNIWKDSSKSYKDLVVLGYEISEEASRFMGVAGKSAEDISKMTVDDIKELSSFFGDEYSITEYASNNTINIAFTTEYNYVPMSSAEWTEYHIDCREEYSFCVDKDSNTGCGVKLGYPNAIETEINPAIQEERQEKLTDSDFEKAGIIEGCKKEIVEYEAMFNKEVEVVEYIGRKGYITKFLDANGLSFIFKCSTNEGKEEYFTATVKNLYVDSNGSMSYEGIVVLWCYDGLSEAESYFDYFLNE